MMRVERVGAQDRSLMDSTDEKTDGHVYDYMPSVFCFC